MIEPLGEVGRIAACPPADVVGQEQLASPLNRSEAIAVAPLFAVEFPLTSLFLATDEIPYLVYLYLHSGEVLHFSRPKSFGVAADSLQEVQKGVAVDACNPLDGTNRVAFQQQPEAQNRLGLFQPHFSQGLGLLLDPRLATNVSVDGIGVGHDRRFCTDTELSSLDTSLWALGACQAQRSYVMFGFVNAVLLFVALLMRCMARLSPAGNYVDKWMTRHKSALWSLHVVQMLALATWGGMVLTSTDLCSRAAAGASEWRTLALQVCVFILPAHAALLLVIGCATMVAAHTLPKCCR